jgi:predicted membrane protein
MNRSATFLGGTIIVVGLMLLAGNLLNINVWELIWPLGLIVLGGWLLLRPHRAATGANVDFRFLGEIRRNGAWQVTPEEMTAFVGDIDLDFRQAVVPVGETKLHLSGFIGDVHVTIPAGFGLRVVSSAFVTDVQFMGQKHEGFLSPVEFSTPSYAAAERKVLLETAWFVGDMRIKEG